MVQADESQTSFRSDLGWKGFALLMLPPRPSESRPCFNLIQPLWYIFTFNSALINNGQRSDKYILFPSS